jgi:hypothetical protein
MENIFSTTLALVHLTSWRREKELIDNKEIRRVVISGELDTLPGLVPH